MLVPMPTPIIVRAVVSDDAMTAEVARLPWEVLDTIARRIVNEVDGVNRVAYDITGKPLELLNGNSPKSELSQGPIS